MITLGRGFALCFLSLAVSCTRPQAAPDTSAADRSAIDVALESFLAGMRASDCNALLGLLATDVVIVPPNMPPASGPDGFRSWCESVFSQVKTKAVTIANRDVTIAGDWGIEHGSFEWTVVPAAGGADVRDQGNFVAIYHRQADGSWKLARDIWNSSLPVPALATAR
jgi:ketosteroid isomerase-like protein